MRDGEWQEVGTERGGERDIERAREMFFLRIADKPSAGL